MTTQHLITMTVLPTSVPSPTVWDHLATVRHRLELHRRRRIQRRAELIAARRRLR